MTNLPPVSSSSRKSNVPSLIAIVPLCATGYFTADPVDHTLGAIDIELLNIHFIYSLKEQCKVVSRNRVDYVIYITFRRKLIFCDLRHISGVIKTTERFVRYA
jgi:hypothetical protein